MKTAIIYYSKHGTTERVTHLIGEKLTNKVDYISLKECPRPDIRTYDRIILGTAIYAGSPNRKVTQFCHNNQPLLEQKVIGLFICCMNEEQEAEEINKAFPEFLQRLSIPKAILGGEFQFDKMNFIERFLTKKIAKINSSVSKLRYDADKLKRNDLKKNEKLIKDTLHFDPSDTFIRFSSLKKKGIQEAWNAIYELCDLDFE